ncbi:hypothetical protein CI238_09635 [Colletotrichum incanum]|uniref:Uncharacterized protein n=1 Tax=Colletotrichum incanum TaxID=1573173 RepID=A0A167EAP9_COLIC|nr:hypothetical protein CI238_09635 [Colletotrichum incanum]
MKDHRGGKDPSKSPNLIFILLSTAAEMVVQPSNTAARPKSTPQPSGPGPTPTASVEPKDLLGKRDDSTRITITQTLPRTLSTRTATVTLHGDIPTEPPPRSSEGVSDQQLGAIIGATCGTVIILLLLGCWIFRRRRQKKSSVKSSGGGNSRFSSPPLRPSPWSPRSSTGPGGRRGSMSYKQTSPSSTAEDFMDDKYSPPSPDFGLPKHPPTYSRPPTGPVHSKTSTASNNPKPPTSSGLGHVTHPPTAPASSNYSRNLGPTVDNRRPSANYSASWMPPPIDRSGTYPAQPQPTFTLPPKSKPPPSFQPGPVKSGMTAMLPGGPLRTGTVPTPRPSGNIPTPPPDPNIITADREKTSRSSSKSKHSPDFSGQGRPGMVPSINKTPRATSSFQHPPTTVLAAPFSGLPGGKKTVKFPEVLEQSIPELPNESDLPSPKHKGGKQKSIPIPPSPRQNHSLKGGEKSTPSELRGDDHPKPPLEGSTEPTSKSENADEANGQTSSPVKSPSGLKSPPSGSQSRVPSPEIINVDEEAPLEGVTEPISKCDDAKKVDAQPNTPASPRSGSKSTPSSPHTTAPSPTVIDVNPGPPIRQDSGSLSHTVKHSKPRAPNTLKSFFEGKSRSRRSSFSVSGRAQTAPVTYSSYPHSAPPPAPPTTTFRRAPALPSDSYYYGQGHTSHYPPPSDHAVEVIVTETTELPQAGRVQADGRRGRQKNNNKIRMLNYIAGKREKKDRRRRSPSRRRPSEKGG